MITLYLILIIAASIGLGFMVLIQNPKGGGLSSNFSSSSQLMGVQKTGDFLEKGTWILAITLMVLSLAINVATKGGADKGDEQKFKEQTDKASKPVGGASAPVSFPTAPQPATPVKK